MGEVTATVCINGKRHLWDCIAVEPAGILSPHEVRWCRRCGSRTEFTGGKRCLEIDGSYFVEVPECIRVREAG